MNLPVNYEKLKPRERRVVREEYCRLQKQKCWYCGRSLILDPSPEVLRKKVTPRLYPPGFFQNPVHLHHDHDTEMTLGAVHAYCNAVLWEHHGQ